MIKANHEAINYTYFTNIDIESNKVHRLDFYYYLTDPFDDAKMTVGLTAEGMTQTIVQVQKPSENKWQHSRTTFTSPSSQIHQVTKFLFETSSYIYFYLHVAVDKNDTLFGSFSDFRFRFG
jgi:hypothetical protein